MNHPEATAAALGILRNPATFQWYIIPLLAAVIYIYANEIQARFTKRSKGLKTPLQIYTLF